MMKYNLPDIRKHDLLMLSVFGSNYYCEQNIKTRTRLCLSDEHLEGCMRIAATEVKLILKDYASKGSVRHLINE
jgi:hypothetical protein